MTAATRTGAPSGNLCFAASLLTPRGRGAVASIRAQGHNPGWEAAWQQHFRAANGKPITEQQFGRILFGRWGNAPGEEIVVSRIDELTAEIHCHGGEAAAQRILSDLQQAGAAIESWNDSIANSNGALQAECADALARATTVRTAMILLEQYNGILESAIRRLEQIPFDAKRTASDVDELLRWSSFGLHLTKPWNVVLTGRPNVGKSSLINALLGYSRSIVFAEPGTTRDVVTAETAFEGWPIQFADTAGIRDSTDTLESAGIERARAELKDADCILLLLDTSRPPHDDDRRFLAEWPDAIIVANKCDLENAWRDELPADAIAVSSLNGSGINDLVAELLKRLVPETPEPGTPLPVTVRQIELLERARGAAAIGDESSFRLSLAECLDGE